MFCVQRDLVRVAFDSAFKMQVNAVVGCGDDVIFRIGQQALILRMDAGGDDDKKKPALPPDTPPEDDEAGKSGPSQNASKKKNRRRRK